MNNETDVSIRFRNYVTGEGQLEKYAKILYSSSRLIEGLPIDNPTEISNLICEIMAD